MSKVNKKYELVKTEECIYTDRGMYRIRALKNFNGIKKGELGGYIENEENLSQEGKCWVYGNAKVYDAAIVYGNAAISDNARVHGSAKVYGNAIVCGTSDVYGNAEIYENAVIYNQSDVCDDAKVYGRASISSQAYIHGMCRIYGEAIVYGKVSGTAKVFHTATICDIADISNDAIIKTGSDYCTVTGFGSVARATTFFRCEDKSIKVNCGCFNGTLDEFRAKVKEAHENNQYAKEYLAIADIVETRLSK